MSTLFAWMPLLVLYGVLPLLDTLIGRDAVNPEMGDGSFYPDVLIPVAVAVGKKGRSLPWIRHEMTAWWLISLCMALLAAYFVDMTGLIMIHPRLP